MKKLVYLGIAMGLLAGGLPVQAGDRSAPKTTAQTEQDNRFKARRKEINRLIKKYKKAPQASKPAIKAQLAQLVSQHVDEQISYMKSRIADERANLDNWEEKIKQDEAHLPAVKAQRVEDLLSGAAKQKQKAAKKAWKKQMKHLKNK